jgi:hypothetical protein
LNRVNTVLCASLVLLASASIANPLLQPRGVPGFIVLAEQRYDPAVQRFMAEQSLAALPLQGGQLFYVYPQNTSNAYIEQMQIRYLEALLKEKQIKSEPAED